MKYSIIFFSLLIHQPSYQRTSYKLYEHWLVACISDLAAKRLACSTPTSVRSSFGQPTIVGTREVLHFTDVLSFF